MHKLTFWGPKLRLGWKRLGLAHGAGRPLSLLSQFHEVRHELARTSLVKRSFIAVDEGRIVRIPSSLSRWTMLWSCAQHTDSEHVCELALCCHIEDWHAVARSRRPVGRACVRLEFSLEWRIARAVTFNRVLQSCSMQAGLLRDP